MVFLGGREGWGGGAMGSLPPNKKDNCSAKSKKKCPAKNHRHNRQLHVPSSDPPPSPLLHLHACPCPPTAAQHCRRRGHPLSSSSSPRPCRPRRVPYSGPGPPKSTTRPHPPFPVEASRRRNFQPKVRPLQAPQRWRSGRSDDVQAHSASHPSPCPLRLHLRLHRQSRRRTSVLPPASRSRCPILPWRPAMVSGASKAPGHRGRSWGRAAG